VSVNGALYLRIESTHQKLSTALERCPIVLPKCNIILALF